MLKEIATLPPAPFLDVPLRQYYEELRKVPTHAATGELSYRTPLENFLNASAFALGFTDVRFTNEPRANALGRPDFKATQNNGLTEIGFVEAEAISASLGTLKDSAKKQNDRFIAGLPNFLQTNHTHFRLFVKGKQVANVALPKLSSGSKAVPDTDRDAFAALLTQFLNEATASATSSETLSRLLAMRASLLRDGAETLLNNGSPALVPLLDAYRIALSAAVTAKQFADVYAQTFAYGLFLAWMRHDSSGPFNRETAQNLLPQAVAPIRALIRFGLVELPEEIAWIVEGIISDLGKADRSAALGARQQDGKEPMIHFYETFLAAYDKKLRKATGTYYTPQSVTDFIVRTVDGLLESPGFELEGGLANPAVHLLDPATGTGTFLARSIRRVKQRMEESGDGDLFPDRVHNHITKHFFGFELLPAAYTLAHLNLRTLLETEGASLSDKERLPIYLANTLTDELPPQQTMLVAAEFSTEVHEADRVKKHERILVILGNPPYKGHSNNPSKYTEKIAPGGAYTADLPSGGTASRINNSRKSRNNIRRNFIGRLLHDYYFVNGVPLNEKNSKWLQNDYVKFIRFAEDMITHRDSGIVAFITDNSYLDASTFRGMRHHLMQTFDTLYILDLHGNSNKRERAPDGTPDRNIFDITQGVAILIAIKNNASSSSLANVYHASMYGTRDYKDNTLLQSDLKTIEWTKLTPNTPHYLFVPQDELMRSEYEAGWSVEDIFLMNNVGIVTARDSLTLKFTEADIWQTVQDFASLDPEDARQKYKLGDDANDWQVRLAQDDLQSSGLTKERIHTIEYRPFDNRFTYYTGRSRGFMCRPRHDVMQHMLKTNLALITPKACAGNWSCLVTNTLAGHKAVADFDINYVFPLYLHPSGENLLETGTEPRSNIVDGFLAAITKIWQESASESDENLEDEKGSEECTETRRAEDLPIESIFHYIYAILHAPSYRIRYADFLKRDFPRIPLPPDPQTFDDAAQIGEKLVALHLLTAPILKQHGIGYKATSTIHTHEVVSNANRYSEVERHVHINANEYFYNVPPEAWNFRIGGYQPAEKWLDDRIGFPLSEDDIMYYRRMIAALRETVALLSDCDDVFLRIVPTATIVSEV